VTVISSISAVLYQISSKLDDFSLRCGDLTIFKMVEGGPPPSWIFKLEGFCHVALVGMPFCFLLHNFAEIGQSVDELWPKKRFSR